MTRTCTRCHVSKPESAYYPSRGRLRPDCKPCYLAAKGSRPRPVAPPHETPGPGCPPRPGCPWSGCRHWLPEGYCVLDVAALGAQTAEVVAGLLGVSHEYVGQVERKALEKIRERHPRLAEGLESEAPATLAEGCKRKGAVRDE